MDLNCISIGDETPLHRVHNIVYNAAHFVSNERACAMYPNLDDTQPNKPVAYPPDDAPQGPGCLAWGIVGIFSLTMAVAIVFVATFAGWSDGLGIARDNATATRGADVAAQCSFLPTDIANENVNLVARRFEDIAQGAALPACAQALAPQATEIYLRSIATATLMPTLTPTLTPTSPPTTAPEITQVAAPDASSAELEFDPTPLLAEARQFIDNEQYLEAVDTLDAVLAIDPNYQRTTVNQLLFDALTREARRLYRTGGNLQEAILLTNRAEEYGSLADSDLNFERAVARLYVDAQAFLNLDYPEAIRLLNQVVSLAPDYRDTRRLLVEQYTDYGDAFAIGGEPCRAVAQFDGALRIQPNPNVENKRQQAEQACIALTQQPNTGVSTPTSP